MLPPPPLSAGLSAGPSAAAPPVPAPPVPAPPVPAPPVPDLPPVPPLLLLSLLQALNAAVSVRTRKGTASFLNIFISLVYVGLLRQKYPSIWADHSPSGGERKVSCWRRHRTGGDGDGHDREAERSFSGPPNGNVAHSSAGGLC